jgi:type IV pilus assembly protein PilQ
MKKFTIKFRRLKSAATLFLFILLTSAFANGKISPTRDPFLFASSTAMPLSKSEKVLVKLHHADAEQISKMLTDPKNNLLSTSGFVTVDKRTNSLWINDYAKNLYAVQKFVADFDQSSKQIQIEARIVSADENFTHELGLEFGTIKTFNGKDSSSDNTSNTLNPGHFDFTIAKLPNETALDMALSALESEGHAKIISRPKLMTIDRMPAYIASGDEIPYQEKTGDGDTSIAFKNAVLSLQVTPELLTVNKILLHLNISQDKVSELMYNGQPAISTRTIRTQVMVNNDETVVLGGVFEESLDNLTEGIPIISKIPIIGKIFTYKKDINQHKELLIFITPKIVV